MNIPVAPTTMTPDRAAEWRKDARSVLPETAEALDANGWSPRTAAECMNSLVGDFTTMSMLLAANATLVAASQITRAVSDLIPEQAIICHEAGLGPIEILRLMDQGRFDPATISAMAALRA